MPEYLLERDGKWHFRVRLDKDIVNFLKENPNHPKPKHWMKELKQKALKTYDLNEAKRLRTIELAVFQQEQETFLKSIKSSAKTPATQSDILRMSMATFQGLRDFDLTLAKGSKEEGSRKSWYNLNLAESQWYQDPKRFEKIAYENLKNFNLTVTDEQLIEFTDLIKRSHHQAYQSRFGEFNKPRPEPFVDEIFSEQLPVQQSLTFSALIDAFKKTKKDDWGDASIDRNYQSLSTLYEVVGGKTNIQSIDPSQVVVWQENLKALPKNRKKIKALNGMSIDKILSYCETNDLPKRAAKTVNFDLDTLKNLFTLAEHRWLITRNPCDVIRRVTDESLADEKRLPFSQVQLEKIFANPIYTGCLNDRTGWNKTGPNIIRRGRFWVPLICLFSGLRLNEACQIWSDDFIEENGAFFFRIDRNPDRRQKTKTLSAVRKIPIHPQLVEMGVFDLMDHDNPHHVFPDLAYDEKKKNYSDTFSSWFGRVLDHQGARITKTSFHSFRHNFKKKVEGTGIDDEHLYKIMGWSPDKKSMKFIYGEITPKELVPYVNQVDYGLDFSHLSIIRE